MRSSWREYARPIIQAVLRETAGQSEREIRKALIEAYPFGERAMHPYKMWLKEIAVQRGRIKPAKAPRKTEAAGQERLPL